MGKFNKNVLVAGMEQSGSTLLFNIIRQIFLQKTIELYSCFYTDYVLSNYKDYQLVKIHNYNENIKNWARVIITTRRDIRDAIASHIRRYGRYIPVEAIHHRLMTDYYGWEKVSNYEFVYEKYMNNKIIIIQELISVLGGIDGIDIGEIIKYVDALPASESLPEKEQNGKFYDEVTLLTKAHFTNKGQIGGYKNVLTEEEESMLNALACKWLSAKGYVLGARRLL
jgi:hypothetical protein